MNDKHMTNMPKKNLPSSKNRIRYVNKYKETIKADVMPMDEKN